MSTTIVFYVVTDENGNDYTEPWVKEMLDEHIRKGGKVVSYNLPTKKNESPSSSGPQQK